MPRDALVLKIQRELCHPKYARKVSGLSRNRLVARIAQSMVSARTGKTSTQPPSQGGFSHRLRSLSQKMVVTPSPL